MSYQIRYTDGVSEKGEIIEKRTINPLLIIIGITVCLGLFFAITATGDTIQGFIYPGNAEITEAAVDHFVDHIREGETVKDAFSTFCLEIIDSANIPDR